MSQVVTRTRLAKWIHKLRYGGYKQTTAALRRSSDDEHTYCCLGVACVVYLEDQIPYEQHANLWVPTLVKNSDAYLFQGWGPYMPPDVASYLGFKHTIPTISRQAIKMYARKNPVFRSNLGNIDQVQYSLSFLNDVGVTFPQIAALIEIEYLDLARPTHTTDSQEA